MEKYEEEGEEEAEEEEGPEAGAGSDLAPGLASQRHWRPEGLN